jgi:ribosome-associated protein
MGDELRVHVPRSKLVVKYSRSGGPGGQNVNKVETKAEVRLALADLAVDSGVLERIRVRVAGRLDAQDRVVVSSSRFRLRARNLRDALDRLQSILDAAALPPVPRVRTAPTKGSRERRLESKARAARKKRERRAPSDE